jgi:hypothetical protein
MCSHSRVIFEKWRCKICNPDDWECCFIILINPIWIFHWSLLRGLEVCGGRGMIVLT